MTTLKKATALHHEGDSARAYALISELQRSLRAADGTLSGERDLVDGLANTLRTSSGGGLDPVSNLPLR